MSADLKMLESIQNTQSISREELGAILQTQDSFLIQELHKKAQQTATQIYGNKIYIRGLIIVKITVIIVASAVRMQKPTDIALQQNRFYPVVKPDGTWDFVHLYYREERILIIQMRRFARSFRKLNQNIRTVQ